MGVDIPMVKSSGDGFYPLTGKRDCLILAVGEFDKDHEYLNRNNAQEDADYIGHSMEVLGFTVTKKVGYISLDDARNAIAELVDNQAQKGKDMISICIMTHGREKRGEILRFSDQRVFFGHLTEPIMNCRELTNKPKICIIQACRGSTNIQQGFLNIDDEEDARDRYGNERYHSCADRGIIWASCNGNKALRPGGRPSFMINWLGQRMKKYAPRGEDLDFIVRRLNYRMKHDTAPHTVHIRNRDDPDAERKTVSVLLASDFEHSFTKKIKFF